MDISAIDRSATRTDGWLRAAAPTSKLVAAGLVLAAVLTTANVLVLAAIALGMVAVAFAGRVPLRTLFALAAYPAVFALVFAFASAPDVLAASVIVGKALCSALAVVTVVLTTPYPQVFAPLQRITPSIVGDALLMTYRATFLLLEKFSNLVRAVRLRAGLLGTHPIRSARATTSALGGLLLYSVDLAQRDYDIMRLRGYSGRLRVTPMRSRDVRSDAFILALAGGALAVAVVWRVGAATLNPYSWIVCLPPLLLLGGAVLYRRSAE